MAISKFWYQHVTFPKQIDLSTTLAVPCQFLIDQLHYNDNTSLADSDDLLWCRSSKRRPTGLASAIAASGLAMANLTLSPTHHSQISRPSIISPQQSTVLPQEIYWFTDHLRSRHLDYGKPKRRWMVCSGVNGGVATLCACGRDGTHFLEMDSVLSGTGMSSLIDGGSLDLFHEPS